MLKYLIRFTRIVEEETSVTLYADSEEDAEKQARGLLKNLPEHWDWSEMSSEDPEVAEVVEDV